MVGSGSVLWDSWTSRVYWVPPFLEAPLLDTYSSLFWSSFAVTSHLCFVALVALVLILLLRTTMHSSPKERCSGQSRQGQLQL